MHPTPNLCPICGHDLTVTRLHCRRCDTAIEGRFAPGPFAGLTQAQLAFVEAFLKSEGKFTRMEGELGLSYPTLRSRLHDILRDLGYEPGADGAEPSSPVDAATRRSILEKLDAGEITTEEAVQQLKGDSEGDTE